MQELKKRWCKNKEEKTKVVLLGKKKSQQQQRQQQDGVSEETKLLKNTWRHLHFLKDIKKKTEDGERSKGERGDRSKGERGWTWYLFINIY